MNKNGGKGRNVLENVSLFPLSPPLHLVTALEAVYRMMGLESIWGEEFFKATDYGIPKVEEQVIRLKRNLSFKALFTFFFA